MTARFDLFWGLALQSICMESGTFILHCTWDRKVPGAHRNKTFDTPTNIARVSSAKFEPVQRSFARNKVEKNCRLSLKKIHILIPFIM